MLSLSTVVKTVANYGGPAIVRANGKLMAIRELPKGEPICREIVYYLIRHCEAADAPRVVHSHHVQDSISVYTYTNTKSPLLRENLRHYVDDRLSDDRLSTVQAGSR
jgi:hypothetical protein